MYCIEVWNEGLFVGYAKRNGRKAIFSSREAATSYASFARGVTGATYLVKELKDADERR